MCRTRDGNVSAPPSWRVRVPVYRVYFRDHIVGLITSILCNIISRPLSSSLVYFRLLQHSVNIRAVWGGGGECHHRIQEEGKNSLTLKEKKPIQKIKEKGRRRNKTEIRRE